MTNGDAVTQIVCRATTFRAVQQDTAACVDWQVFHGWREDDPNFSGAVTVLDQHGAQVDLTSWAAPTDASADVALTGIGWQRTAPWTQDWLGRRVAAVKSLPRTTDGQASTSQPVPYPRRPEN